MSRALGISLQCLVSVGLIYAAQHCYKMNLISCKMTDSPDYRATIEIDKDNMVQSVTNVYKEVRMPVWHIKFIQYSPNYKRMHYNGTVNACEFSKFIKRVRVFRDIFLVFEKPESGNFTLKCPMSVGTYVMKNMYVPSDFDLLKIIYAPNSTYTLYGTILSLLSRNRMEKLCAYEINATISKRC